MTDKVFTLEEEISLTDFLGVENSNIKEVAGAFPLSKIISRGNQILIKGNIEEINRISDVIESMIEHLQKYGRLSVEQVKSYIREDAEAATHETPDDELILVGTKGNAIRAKTANQKKMVEAGKNFDIVFATGPAGTGKTYTAVALAVKALKEKQVKKIIITRPAVEAGENLGFLPGDLKEKIDPYLRPIYDALEDMIQSEKLKFYIENRTIEIAPLAYMRGRTLNNAFILLDEAQNTTPMQIKMFLTRMGPLSKAIITGDKTQIDLPSKQKSGLADALYILKDVKGIGFIELDDRDVVRHRLVRDILKAYEKAEEN
ncbi:PhoH family protein [Emticicia oligotrophica DSM 17448]|uniref:PhoH-like protein n=1 Tax=Emticicia oligotrophica (strain DSM 17448 / CIP 109782 / MTCC 6937 / GPTSA100-15) TaxID=929562 RepID=A0ABM5N710_EMTOG|nr:PhoH family protein [Emticicia oligotrophica]AFK05297.1 PhoH family protein [Emticicia oligotrophica DSM 17448]